MEMIIIDAAAATAVCNLEQPASWPGRYTATSATAGAIECRPHVPLEIYYCK